MPNPKITFRIWPDAQDKLWDEVKRYKGDIPPCTGRLGLKFLLLPDGPYGFSNWEPFSIRVPRCGGQEWAGEELLTL
jgi:hypothetical protein